MSSKSDKNGSSKSAKDAKSRSDKDDAPKSDKYEAPKSGKNDAPKSGKEDPSKSGKDKDSRDDDKRDKDDHRADKDKRDDRDDRHDGKKGGDRDDDHDGRGGHDSHGNGHGNGHDSHGNGHGYGHHEDDDHDGGGHGSGHGHGNGNGNGHDSHGNGHGYGHHEDGDHDGHGNGHGNGHDHHGNGHGNGHDHHGNGHGYGHHHGNSAPVANPDSAQATEDTSLVILAARLLANDCDRNGDPLRIVSVQGAVNGAVSLDAAGNVVFVPAPDFNGNASFTYTVSDGRGGTATTTVSVRVAAVNDAPSAEDDSASVTGGTPHLIAAASLLANDSDIDGDALSLVSVQNAVDGSVALNAAGDVVFTPAPGFNGTASFTYTVSDGQGGFATATVKVLVESGNANPVAVGDSVAGVEDAAVVIPVSRLLANDTDPDGDTPVLQSVQGAVNGSVALDGLGNVVFTPAPDFFGTASFQYTISDGHGGTATATVKVVVANVPDAPEANPDAVDAVEDTPLAIPAAQLLANDVDADGDLLTITAVQNATGGSVALVGTDIVFTPDRDFNGPAGFQYTVDDGHGGTSTATVLVTVAAVNDAPVADTDVVDAVEDTALVISPAQLLANDSDVDGDVPFIQSVQGAVNGTVSLDVDGNVVFVPAPDFSGAASFTYTVADGQGGVATATVNVNVEAVADAPVVTVPGEPAFGGGPLFQINASAEQTQSAPVAYMPAATRLADGTVAVVWGGFDPTTGTNDILARQYGANGTPLGAQTQASLDPAPGESPPSGFNPAVAALADGGYVVAWNSLIFDTSGIRSDILARRFDADGTPRGGEIRVDAVDAETDADVQPVLVTTPDGGFIVFWQPVGATDTDIHGRRFGPDDAPLGDEFVASTSVTAGDSASVPAVVVLADGDLQLVWQSFDPVEGTYSVVSQRMDAAGAPIGAANVIGTSDSSVIPALTALVDGGYVVAWQDDGGIVAQRFDAGGSAQGAAIEVVPAGGVASDPSVSAQAGGGFVITWTTEGTAVPPATGAVTDVMGRQYDASGAPRADVFRVDSVTRSTHESESSVVSMDGDNFFVAFTSQAAPGPYGDVVGRVYGGGVMVSTPEDVPILLNIGASVADADGSESLSVLIEGVTSGTLSAGTDLGDGRWLLAPEDLPGLSYTFNGNFNGSVALSVTATTAESSNGSSASTRSVQLMFISVEPVNDAPEADDAAFSTFKNGALTGVVTGSDIDGDALTYAIAQGSANGSMLFSADGTFTYTPNTGFFGTDGFTFTAIDSSGAEGVGTVTIEVIGQNEVPVAVSSGIWTNADTPAAGTLTASDSDTSAANLNYLIGTGPEHGLLFLGSGGAYTYVPTAGYLGPDAFTFSVTDPDGASSASATVIIDVASVGGGDGGGTINLTSSQTGNQFMAGGGGRAMAVLDTGEHVIAWVDAATLTLHGQRIGIDGNPAGPSFQIDQGGSLNQNVALASLFGGGFVAVWEDLLTGQLLMRQFDSDAVPFGAPLVVSGASGPLLGATFPAAVVEEFADPVPVLQIAWESGGAVYQASVVLSDGTFTSVTTLDAGPDAHSPTAALLDDGSTLIVWQSGGDILAQNLLTGVTLVVNGGTALDATIQSEPQAVGLQDGGFIVTWTSDGQDGDAGGIFAQRFEFDGADYVPLGGEFQVNTTATGTQVQSSVTVLDDGGFLVSWMSTQNGDADLYAQRYDADGAPSGGEFRIDSTLPGSQLLAEVMGLPDGTFAAAWTSDESGSLEVYSRIFGGAPDPGSPKDVGGTAGNDVIIGSLLDDILVGNDGDDILSGLDGNDTLAGGAGRDVMSGGAGSDKFVWGSGETGEGDVVTDYSYADGDVLEVCDLLVGFNPGTSDVNDFLQLREEGGDTIIDVNTDGVGSDFVQLAALSGVTGLDLTDMVLNNRIVVFCE